jgi:hypothetical protein
MIDELYCPHGKNKGSTAHEGIDAIIVVIKKSKSEIHKRRYKTPSEGFEEQGCTCLSCNRRERGKAVFPYIFTKRQN